MEKPEQTVSEREFPFQIRACALEIDQTSLLRSLHLLPLILSRKSFLMLKVTNSDPSLNPLRPIEQEAIQTCPDFASDIIIRRLIFQINEGFSIFNRTFSIKGAFSPSDFQGSQYLLGEVSNIKTHTFQNQLDTGFIKINKIEKEFELVSRYHSLHSKINKNKELVGEANYLENIVSRKENQELKNHLILSPYYTGDLMEKKYIKNIKNISKNEKFKNLSEFLRDF